MERDRCLESLNVQMQRLERGRFCASEPALQHRLRALREWQANRLAVDYADQRAIPARRDAVTFFLEDVYGTADFTQRDEQFARAMRHLQRLLPTAALAALRDAVELQALSVELDTDVASRLPATMAAVDGAGYAAAYRAANRAADRQRQIDLAVAIGRRLQLLTSHPATELAMRIAAGPARIAGFGALHSFIERGYRAFQRLGADSVGFVDAIESRETNFMQRLCGIAERAPGASAGRDSALAPSAAATADSAP